METIIYLMLEKKKEEGGGDSIPPLYRIWQADEDFGLLYVKVPWARLDPWELRRFLPPFTGRSVSVSTVYDGSMSEWLQKRGLRGWWLQGWQYPEYGDYRRVDYARQLLRLAGQAGRKRFHYLVLGFEAFVPEVLAPYLREMKSLRFLVGKKDELPEDFAEEVCEEYGLAVSCGVAPGKGDAGPFFHFVPECPLPTVILDLTGEAYLSAARTAPGSVWLDMDSLEEKRRRVEAALGGDAYFSIKKEWGRAGKKTPAALDTALKNGYNRAVN